MSFTRALYYPDINIRDPEWLKTAVLYWDTIETIVPKSIENPYKGKEQKACADAGILVKRHAVDHPDVLDRVGRIARDFYKTPNARKMVQPANGAEQEEIYNEKMSFELRDFLTQNRRSPDNRETLIVSKSFGHYYMTLLATELAKKLGESSLTDRALAHELVKDVVRGASNHIPVSGETGGTLLVELMLDKIQIAPELPIERIIKFRDTHKDELGEFRAEVSSLARQLQNLDPESAKLEIADIYKNKIEPAVNNLRKSLTASRIKWLLDGTLKVATLSVSTTALVSTIAAPPVAVVVAGGLTLLALAASRYCDEGEARRKSPYSYLLSLKRLSSN